MNARGKTWKTTVRSPPATPKCCDTSGYRLRRAPHRRIGQARYWASCRGNGYRNRGDAPAPSGTWDLPHHAKGRTCVRRLPRGARAASEGTLAEKHVAAYRSIIRNSSTNIRVKRLVIADDTTGMTSDHTPPASSLRVSQSENRRIFPPPSRSHLRDKSSINS